MSGERLNTNFGHLIDLISKYFIEGSSFEETVKRVKQAAPRDYKELASFTDADAWIKEEYLKLEQSQASYIKD